MAANRNELHLRPLPFLDSKWLRADLISNLRNVEDSAVLWNNLIQDCELVSSQVEPVVNEAGNLSYLGDDGKHYCGVEKLMCPCCSCYCGPLSGCNCGSCRLLDSELAIKKITTNLSNSMITSSDSFFESWLWGVTPNQEQKVNCLKTLLRELHDISLQAAGNCLSSVHLLQQLFIYERYYVALSRCKQQQLGNFSKCFSQDVRIANTEAIAAVPGDRQVEKSLMQKFKSVDLLMGTSFSKKNERATMSLARVGTRAALNFSFAFLRRAWRSGEDTEICSELLSEALESLQDLPEASLFDESQICDYKMKIRAVNANYQGANHDSHVWALSPERRYFERRYLSGSRSSFLLGDSGYPLEPWLMTPYRTPTPQSARSRFNICHRKARNIVERSIGLLKGRFRCLLGARQLHYAPLKAAQIVNVCCALHNICLHFDSSYEIFEHDVNNLEEELEIHDIQANLLRSEAATIRNEIVQLNFNS